MGSRARNGCVTLSCPEPGTRAAEVVAPRKLHVRDVLDHVPVPCESLGQDGDQVRVVHFSDGLCNARGPKMVDVGT